MYQNLAKVNNYLVSNKLGHSYSKLIHNLFGVNYELKEIDKASLDFDFGFINVTIPYKKDYAKLANVLSQDVKESGACNLVVNKNGTYYAYNTDLFGIDYTFKYHQIDLNGKKILILGSGATSHTLQYYLKDFNCTYQVLSRSNGSYEKEDYYDSDIIVNATPYSMYPNINFDNLVDLEKFTNLEFVFDFIYNPFLTPLLQQAKELNISYSNGLRMLVYQAYKAYDYLDFVPKLSVEEVVFQIEKLHNIVLIGMPGSGKSTVAKELALIYKDKKLIELDELNDVDILTDERGFRSKEKALVKKYAKENNQIISCGGGVILDSDNMKELALNGIIFYLDFPLLELLERDFVRPRIKTKEEYIKVYNSRLKLYEQYADYKVKGVKDIVKDLGY